MNLLHALPEIGGAWNYMAELLAGIGQCDTSNSYVCFVTGSSEGLVPSSANFDVVKAEIRSNHRPRRILYENTALQIQVRRHRLDLMHWFANTQGLTNAVPAAVTFYDLMVFAKPKAFSIAKQIYLKTMMRQTALRAELLLPMSQATATDLRRLLSAPSDRIVVIPPILPSRFRPANEVLTQSLKARYALPDRFWVYVAHFYPHKNHLRLLDAYQLLKANGARPWPLVLCGDLKGFDDAIHGAIAERGLNDDVVLISAGAPKETGHPRLTLEELPILFSAAEAQVFPSLFEGAGIPVLESMACGCSLLASDIPSVREFAVDAAEYFNPHEASSIAAALLAFQGKPDERNRLRARGLARVAEFRAEPVVHRLAEAYGKTIARRRKP